MVKISSPIFSAIRFTVLLPCWILLAATSLMPPVLAAGSDCRSADAAESDAIAAVSKRFSAAFVGNDMRALTDTYTEDGVIMPPHRRLQGHEAIAGYFKWKGARRQLAHAMTTESLRICGDFAFDWGHWTSKFTFDDAAAREATGTYFVVWKRSSNGEWKIQQDVWHGAARE